MNFKDFAFVGDVILFEPDSTSIDIGKFMFCKPESGLLLYIKDFVDKSLSSIIPVPNMLEYERIPNNATPNSFDFMSLPQNKWRYTIIKHNEGYINNIPLALALSELRATVIFQGAFYEKEEMPDRISGIFSPLVAQIFFSDNNLSNSAPKLLTSSIATEIGQIYCSLVRFDDIKTKFNEIQKALSDFIELHKITDISPFKVLGYFSILELLLSTFEPQKRDSSLREQLKSKINLLNNQLITPLQACDYVKGPDELTFSMLIDSIYLFRNDIAHGNKTDFERKLRILKGDRKRILNFLYDVTRMVLIKAINEPLLIRDLKAC